jgi:protein OS-9
VDAPAADGALAVAYEAVVLQGQRYLCSIPTIPDDVPHNNTASAEEAKAEEEKELVRATDRGWELLEGMRGSCIYYLSGWWSYSFCYKNEVKQFHQLPPSRGVPIYPPVEDTSVHSFVLGRFSNKDEKKKKDAARKTLGTEAGSKEPLDDEGNAPDEEEKALEIPRLESKGSSRYMVQRLTDGTECDLTGKPRKIDVQVRCA